MVSKAARANWWGVCVVCSSEFQTYVPPSRNPPATCSQRCNGSRRGAAPLTAESIEKRKRFGPHHHAWKGDAVSVRGGRTRAIRMYPETPVTCDRCGKAKPLDRHHVDANTANNSPENIRFLCRLCHMTGDARLSNLIEGRRNGNNS